MNTTEEKHLSNSVKALKTKAVEEGIPYQTLVTRMLYEYVTRKIVEKKADVLAR